MELPLTGNDWREAFSELSDALDQSYIIPADSEGVLWEMQSLRDRALLDKCVLLLPPARDAQNYWCSVRRAYYRIGLGFPDFAEHVSISRMNNRGEPTVRVDAQGKPEHHLADFVADVIADRFPTERLTNAVGIARRWHRVRRPARWLTLAIFMIVVWYT